MDNKLLTNLKTPPATNAVIRSWNMGWGGGFCDWSPVHRSEDKEGKETFRLIFQASRNVMRTHNNCTEVTRMFHHISVTP